MSKPATYYPVALNLQGRKTVVIGGDEEAARKARGLLAGGAKVTVISPAATDAIQELARAGAVTLCSRPYHEGDLQGAALAVVCEGDPEVVRAEADRARVLLNVLDKPELCDFIAMATIARDGLQFSVHTSGRSAVLSRRIRERLESRFGEEYGGFVRMLGELRPAIRRLIPSAKARREFWLEVIGPGTLDRIDKGLDPRQLRAEIVTRAEDYGRAVVQTGENS